MAKRIKDMGRLRIISVAAAMVVLCSATIIMVAAATTSQARSISVADGSVSYSVETDDEDPLQIMALADISLGENDTYEVFADKNGKIEKISVIRACAIYFDDNGEDGYYIIGYGTLEKTLAMQGISVNVYDELNVPLDTPVTNGMKVKIKRAFSVTVNADGESHNFKMTEGTVGDALKLAGVELDNDDETQPTIDTVLKKDTDVDVLRIEYVLRSTTQEIKFSTSTHKKHDMYKGETKIGVKGVNGEKSIVYKDRYVNGKLATTSVNSEKVTKKPVEQVIYSGIVPRVSSLSVYSKKPISGLPAPAGLKLDSNGLPVNFKKVIDGTAKAYSGDTSTSTGRTPRTGHIAVNPKQIPYGTEMYIVSLDGKYVYGYSIAADTGGFVYNDSCTVDLFMNSESDCYQWGHRAVRIYIL